LLYLLGTCVLNNAIKPVFNKLLVLVTQ